MHPSRLHGYHVIYTMACLVVCGAAAFCLCARGDCHILGAIEIDSSLPIMEASGA